MSRRLRIAASSIAGCLLVGGVLTDQWIVHPEVDDPGAVDAIFVLGGGGSRIEYALDLAREGVATNVVFAAAFVVSENVWAAPCNSRRPAGLPDDTVIRCIEPDPATTRGEAQLLGDLAAEEDWESVVVVASTDQITRARRLIERCWDGELRLMGPDHDQSWLTRIVYEWGAGLKATVVRGC